MKPQPDTTQNQRQYAPAQEHDSEHELEFFQEREAEGDFAGTSTIAAAQNAVLDDIASEQETDEEKETSSFGAEVEKKLLASSDDDGAGQVSTQQKVKKAIRKALRGEKEHFYYIKYAAADGSVWRFKRFPDNRVYAIRAKEEVKIFDVKCDNLPGEGVTSKGIPLMIHKIRIDGYDAAFNAFGLTDKDKSRLPKQAERRAWTGKLFEMMMNQDAAGELEIEKTDEGGNISLVLSNRTRRLLKIRFHYYHRRNGTWQLTHIYARPGSSGTYHVRFPLEPNGTRSNGSPWIYEKIKTVVEPDGPVATVPLPPSEAETATQEELPSPQLEIEPGQEAEAAPEPAIVDENGLTAEEFFQDPDRSGYFDDIPEMDPLAALDNPEFGEKKRSPMPDKYRKMPGDQTLSHPLLDGKKQLMMTLNRDNPNNHAAQRNGHYLGENSYSSDVPALKKAIIALYPDEKDNINVDSKNLDKNTAEAFKRLQRDAGLEDDGVIGPDTLKALNDALMKEKVTYDSTSGSKEMPEKEVLFAEFKGDDYDATGRMMSNRTSSNRLLTKPHNIPANQTDTELAYGEEFEIIATSAEHSKGYYYIKTKDGKEGWISEVPVRVQVLDDSELHLVQKDEELEDIIANHYLKSTLEDGSPNPNYFEVSTGNDNRTIAAAIFIANKEKNVVYLDESKRPEGSMKDAFDPFMAKERALYQMIGIRENQTLELPSPEDIKSMQEAGLIGTRPEFMNDMIEVGRSIEGFIVGVGTGFVEGAVDMVEGLWDMVKSIFSGEIFGQIDDMIDSLLELTWEDFKELVAGLFDMTVQQIKDAWNNPNPYQKWEFFGEVVGKILFEVVIGMVTGGAGLTAKLGKLGKLGKTMQKISKQSDKINPSDAAKFKKIDADRKKTHRDKEIDNRKETDPNLNRNADEILENPHMKQLDNKGRDAAKKDGRDVDAEAEAEMNKPENKPKDKDEENHRADKIKALATAKAIEAADDLADVPISTLMSHLGPLEKIKGVKDFEKVPNGEGVWDIYMIGSRSKVDRFTNKEIEKARKSAKKIIENAKQGKIRRTSNYHGRLDNTRELDILSNPDAVYKSTGKSERLIFRKDGDVVILEGKGATKGQAVTSYGPSGPRGNSGSSIFGGSPTDPGLPINHQDLIDGKIPTPSGETLAPAIEVKI